MNKIKQQIKENSLQYEMHEVQLDQLLDEFDVLPEIELAADQKNRPHLSAFMTSPQSGG